MMNASRSTRTWVSARLGPIRLAVAIAAVALMVAAGQGPAAAAGSVHAPIVGAGSTWSANALQAWIRNVWANYQWKITYSESGSTQGRNNFANGTADFGVSEIPYGIANSNEADQRPSRKFAYMPIVAGGTALMYNLNIGGKRVTNLRLSGDTTAKIFTGVITRWDDAAIKADNPALALPGIPIVPVVRSDGSGATAQVSIWLRQEHTALWDAYCGKVGRPMVNGHCGVTSNYPVQPGSGMVAKAGSNGVAGYVAQGHAVGAITFVEYSYALNSGYPVAKLLNAAGYYTEPTAYAVAVALLQAKINEDESSPNYLTQNLDGVYTDKDSRNYPLSSYSYIILPTATENDFTENKGLTLADFGAYFLCEGQQSADVLGYSPLPINLVQAGQKQIQKIPGGDPKIKGINDCNNPTFSADGSNKLAKDAPYPPDCDKKGPTQCTTGTGGASDSPNKPGGGGGSGGGSGGGGGGSGGGGAGGAGPGAGPVGTAPDGTPLGADGNPAVGAAAAGDAAVVGTGDPVLANATPQTLSAPGGGALPRLAMFVAAAGMLAFAALPPILGRRSRRSLLPGPRDGQESSKP